MPPQTPDLIDGKKGHKNRKQKQSSDEEGNQPNKKCKHYVEDGK